MECFEICLLPALLAARPAATAPARALPCVGKEQSTIATPAPAVSSTLKASVFETRLAARQQRGPQEFDLSTAEDRQNGPKACGVSSVTFGQHLKNCGVAIRQSFWNTLAVEQERETYGNDTFSGATVGAAAAVPSEIFEEMYIMYTMVAIEK